MKKIAIIILLVACLLQTKGQSVTRYHSSTFEFDFSSALVNGKQYNPVLRFSGFYNAEHQFHFDFSKHFGIYTGLGIHNVGLITHPTDSLKIKQRAYGLIVPIGIKIGNVSKRSYITIGASLDFFFNYKQKIFVEGANKIKSNDWFSNKVNAFNPSAFLAYENKKGFYIIGRYYLLNFLTTKASVNVINTPYIPETSQLFYIGIGVNVKTGGMKKNNSISPPKKVSA